MTQLIQFVLIMRCALRQKKPRTTVQPSSALTAVLLFIQGSTLVDPVQVIIVAAVLAPAAFYALSRLTPAIRLCRMLLCCMRRFRRWCGGRALALVLAAVLKPQAQAV